VPEARRAVQDPDRGGDLAAHLAAERRVPRERSAGSVRAGVGAGPDAPGAGERQRRGARRGREDRARDVSAGKARRAGCAGERPVPADLAQPADRERVVTAAQNQFGAVDVLVNNAAVFFPKSFHRSSARELEHAVEVNLVAPLVLSALALPGMLERGRGHIVNLGSLAGRIPPGYTESYAATKAALIAFSAALRASYRGKGVSRA